MEDVKKQINETLRGPMLDGLKALAPAIDALDYDTIKKTPEVADLMIQLFRKNRAQFDQIIVDKAGTAVADDDTPLVCERSVNEIVSMFIRSCAAAFARAHFAGKDDDLPPPQIVERSSFVSRIQESVAKLWGREERPRSAADPAKTFYEGIRDKLYHDWQVPLIPAYAELPMVLLEQLGDGLLTLKNPEGLHTLAEVGREDFNAAQEIAGAELGRRMLDKQPLAAKGIAKAGKEEFDRLIEAAFEEIDDGIWDLFCDPEVMEMLKDQTTTDIEALAPHLMELSTDAFKELVATFPSAKPMRVLLDNVRQACGKKGFATLFGANADAELQKKLLDKIKTLDVGGDFSADVNIMLEVFISTNHLER